MEGDLLRRTLKTTGVMLASWVAFVGSLTLIALLVVSSALGPSKTRDAEPSAAPAPPAAPEGPAKVRPRGIDAPAGARRPT